jgi:hypothetical protein
VPAPAQGPGVSGSELSFLSIGNRKANITRNPQAGAVSRPELRPAVSGVRRVHPKHVQAQKQGTGRGRGAGFHPLPPCSHAARRFSGQPLPSTTEA